MARNIKVKKRYKKNFKATFPRLEGVGLETAQCCFVQLEHYLTCTPIWVDGSKVRTKESDFSGRVEGTFDGC